jgi:hypothetical protein
MVCQIPGTRFEWEAISDPLGYFASPQGANQDQQRQEGYFANGSADRAKEPPDAVDGDFIGRTPLIHLEGDIGHRLLFERAVLEGRFPG